jgi:hypothetical protein
MSLDKIFQKSWIVLFYRTMNSRDALGETVPLIFFLLVADFNNKRKKSTIAKRNNITLALYLH